jgi:hypothetical protein
MSVMDNDYSVDPVPILSLRRRTLGVSAQELGIKLSRVPVLTVWLSLGLLLLLVVHIRCRMWSTHFKVHL